MSNPASIVQFPHPGGEHAPQSDSMAWNIEPHRRKFLTSRGRLVDINGATEQETDIVFWGEWEPPSRIVERWKTKPTLPTVLHEPYWETPGSPGFRQNTDPWVFGDSFLYSNCKQLTPYGGPSALQRLPVGSVILFGSTLHGQFVLDTVFVVAKRLGEFSPVTDGTRAGAAFRECTVRSLASGKPEHASAQLTLYRGATPTDPVNGTFSFVPCLPRDAVPPRFARPAVEFDGVNPASRQSPLGAKNLRPATQISEAWNNVARQVLQAGLELGTGIATPPRRRGSTRGTPAPGRPTC